MSNKVIPCATISKNAIEEKHNDVKKEINEHKKELINLYERMKKYCIKK
jgi:hypothetical protein